MPTYPTTGPITVTIQLAQGPLHIEASPRSEATVEVVPSNPQHEPDVRAAEATRVEYTDGTLRVTGPKTGTVGILRKPGSVSVTISVPEGSNIQAATGLGRVTSTGPLGRCRIRSGAGDVNVQDAHGLDVTTGFGSISAGHVSGDASCVTGSGGVRVADVDGSMTVKNSNGETWIGGVGQAVKVKSSNGSVTIERARNDVRLATANGNLRVGSAEQGTVELRTAMGRIEVGLPEGTAARLDLHTSFGSVVNQLEATQRPASDDSIVTMSARTSAGDIVICRAPTLG